MTPAGNHAIGETGRSTIDSMSP